jgi:hypothetical protein
MIVQPRIRALEDRHAMLEKQLASEDARPRPDELAVARLKREKLRLKEEIDRRRQ